MSSSAEALLKETPVRLSRRLQLRRIFQQLDHPLEQTPRAAAIEATMIETQRDLRFRFWNEFVFRFIPHRRFLSNAKTENHCLIGQGNWRAPIKTERAEVRDGRDSA